MIDPNEDNEFHVYGVLSEPDDEFVYRLLDAARSSTRWFYALPVDATDKDKARVEELNDKQYKRFTLLNDVIGRLYPNFPKLKWSEWRP